MSLPRRRPRGQGTVSRRGAWWYIRWRQGGKRMTARFPREDLARESLAKKLAEVSLGLVGLASDPVPDTSTIAELANDWLDRRDGTHRAAGDDRSRFKMHLTPYFGHMRPAQVTKATIREFIENRLRTKVSRFSAEGEAPNLSSTTVGHCVRTLSTFMADLEERGLVEANPCWKLPRSTRRLIRNAHDPKDTPFLRTKDDIRRVYLALPEPYNVMFAVAAQAGLRTAEVIALDWGSIDMETRRIHVRQQVQDGKLCGTKDSDSRIAPILDTLLPILREWHLKTGGVGLLFRPRYPRRGGRPDLGRPAQFIRQHTLNARLQKALEASGLGERGLRWYRSTRHTMASHWVLDGRSMERLRLILGHEDLGTTMRYAHLTPGSFSAEDLAAVGVDFSQPAGRVIALAKRRRADKVGALERKNDQPSRSGARPKRQPLGAGMGSDQPPDCEEVA